MVRLRESSDSIFLRMAWDGFVSGLVLCVRDAVRRFGMKLVGEECARGGVQRSSRREVSCATGQAEHSFEGAWEYSHGVRRGLLFFQSETNHRKATTRVCFTSTTSSRDEYRV